MRKSRREGVGRSIWGFDVFSRVLDFFYRLRIARSPDVVSSLVSPWRPVRRLVLSIRLSLVACSYCSHFVSWDVSFFISFYRLVFSCLLVSFFIFAFPGWRLVLSPCLHPSVSSYRLAGTSCLLVSFFPIRLSYRLADLDRAFLRGGAYHPDVHASRSTAAR